VSNVPDFLAMSAEDILTLIEEADKILDQKIAAEKTELAERAHKLQRLEARRAGKIGKTKSAPAKPRHVNGKANGKAEPAAPVQHAAPAE
jgi:hypothetical protein